MLEIVNKSEGQETAEAKVESFRKGLGPFVVAAEKTRMAMVFTDAKAEDDNPIIFANDSFLLLTGYTREEVLGQSFNSLLARDGGPEPEKQVVAAFEGNADDELELHCHRRDGTEFWTSLFITPVRDKSGDIVQHFVSFANLTKFKQEQGQSRMLIEELNHRVKNTLSTVQSIVSQALRKSSDPAVIRESIEDRLFALSRSHDLLTRESWKQAGLLELVNEALKPFRVVGSWEQRFAIAGENVHLPPKVTLALGIAFHELATNAMKYGALSNERGSISIACNIEPRPEGDRLILRWQERDGPRVLPPSHRGFGSQVLERGLAYELQGSVHLAYQTEGVVCTINIPVARDARGR
jgi:PAS domain S-box-containing protein